MSAVEVVAATIAAHELSYNLGTCRCQNWPLGITHAAHVAGEVVRALGLADEWSYVTEGDVEDGALFPGGSEITDDRAWAEEWVAERCQSCDYCRNAQPKRLIHRSVTPWSAVEGTP